MEQRRETDNTPSSGVSLLWLALAMQVLEAGLNRVVGRLPLWLQLDCILQPEPACRRINSDVSDTSPRLARLRVILAHFGRTLHSRLSFLLLRLAFLPPYSLSHENLAST